MQLGICRRWMSYHLCMGLNVYSMLLRDKLVLSIGAGGDTVAGLCGLTHPLAVLY